MEATSHQHRQKPCYCKAIVELKKEVLLPFQLAVVALQPVVEVLHLPVLGAFRLINPMLGFQSMRTVRATITGFEVMPMFEKGQFKLWIDAIGGGTEAHMVGCEC